MVWKTWPNESQVHLTVNDSKNTAINVVIVKEIMLILKKKEKKDDNVVHFDDAFIASDACHNQRVAVCRRSWQQPYIEVVRMEWGRGGLTFDANYWFLFFKIFLTWISNCQILILGTAHCYLWHLHWLTSQRWLLLSLWWRWPCWFSLLNKTTETLIIAIIILLLSNDELTIVFI